jgi:hypothetical protein
MGSIAGDDKDADALDAELDSHPPKQFAGAAYLWKRYIVSKDIG